MAKKSVVVNQDKIKIEDLKNEVADLKGKVTDLEGQIVTLKADAAKAVVIEKAARTATTWEKFKDMVMGE
jgi:hypothetical protein